MVDQEQPPQRNWIRNTFKRENLSAAFFLLVAASVSGLALSLFRWQLVHLLTLFVEPFLEFVVWGFYIVTVVAAILRAIFAKNRTWPYRLMPLPVVALTLLIFLFVPFTQIELKFDFWRHRQVRSAVASHILTNVSTFKPTRLDRPDLLKLTKSEANLSEDGEVMVVHAGQKQMVFFFTFRGILERYSGFVYSATDIPPEGTDFDGNFFEVEHLQEHWYWVASH